MGLRSAWLAVLVAFLMPSVAVAEDTEGVDGIGTAEDPNVPDDEETTGDRPDEADAVTGKDLEGPAVVKKARPTKATYPMAIIERPLTLTETQIEVTFEMPVLVGPVGADAQMTQVLRGAYGITQDIQVGLSYGFGLEQLGPNDFEPGKAFSVDGGYAVVPGILAATISLPFYVDPFAWSVTLGAPFRLKVSDKVAFVGGQELLQIKLVEMPVSVSDPGQNIGQLAAIATSQPAPAGHLNLQLGVLYQHKPNLALSAQMGYFLTDFSSDEQMIPVTLGIIWSKDNKLDLGGRAGVNTLESGDDRFAGIVSLFAAYRL